MDDVILAKMEEPFVKFLLSLGSFGTVLLILIVAGPLCYGIYKFARKVINEHDEKVKSSVDKENHEQGINDSITGLVGTVGEIQSTLNSVVKQNTDFKATLDIKLNEFEEKINKIHDESVNGDTDIKRELQKNNEDMDIIKRKMSLILDSDREGNRALITNEYYNAVEKGYIPVYKLESLELVYEKYLLENGNKFVSHLMDELRKMPHELKNEK